MKYYFVSIFFFLSFFSCGCKDTPLQPPSASLSEDDQIRYTVFSNMIVQYNSDEILWFLGLDDDESGTSKNRYDPSEQLLLAMQVSYPNVRKYSQAAWNSHGWVCDKLDSTKTGGFVLACPLSWTSPSEVNLECVVQFSLKVASGSRCFLHKQNSAWVIDSVKTTWRT